MAAIDPKILENCEVLGRFPLSHVLLLCDANYPWVLLVPDRENITESFQLTLSEQAQLNSESMCLAKNLAELFSADKMNIAMIGNIVPQLHVHHVVRYTDDIAWPKPVWGAHPAKKYTAEKLQQTRAAICQSLEKNCEGFILAHG